MISIVLFGWLCYEVWFYLLDELSSLVCTPTEQTFLRFVQLPAHVCQPEVFKHLFLPTSTRILPLILLGLQLVHLLLLSSFSFTTAQKQSYQYCCVQLSSQTPFFCQIGLFLNILNLRFRDFLYFLNW